MRLEQIGLVTDRQAITPAVLDMGERLRLFVGIPDEDFRSSIYTIDVNPNDPGEVWEMSEEPYLDFGNTDGIIPAFVTPSIIWTSVFTRRDDAPFQMSLGFYINELDITMVLHDGLIVGGICFCDGCIYQARGDRFVKVGDGLKPAYEVYLGPPFSERILACQDDEYRIGKPHVWKDDGYHMLCTAYALPDNRSYLVYATSPDGLDWARQPLEITGDVFESPIYAYRCGGWVFFNGNGRGEGGVGYGKLHD